MQRYFNRTKKIYCYFVLSIKLQHLQRVVSFVLESGAGVSEMAL